MTKKRQRTIKLKRLIENHPLLIIVGVMTSLVGSVLAANSLWELSLHTYNSTIGWKQVEQSKIDRLAPLEPLQYINEVLGTPILKEEPHVLGFSKYTYKGKGYWVNAYVDQGDIVKHLVITACGESGFFPTIKNNPIGGTIRLGKTPMKFAGFSSSANEYNQPAQPNHSYYFLRGATAPSFFYDEYYYGNPSTYQTVIAGFDEYCGGVNFPNDILEALTDKPFGKNPLNNEQTERLRAHVPITTLAISAPHEKSLFDSRSPFHIGITYADVGILQRYPRKSLEEIENNRTQYDNAKPFEIIRFD